MGLAASQARLLTITARLADNELRSQTINNAKMRLSTQSAQASEDYVNALNKATMKFSNYDLNGEALNQNLTFNALTAYSSYNTQYGLVNSSGQLLVSEEEAVLFEKADGNLNSYLQYHGLKYDTTYYDNVGSIQNEGYVEPYNMISVSDMKTYFEGYNSFENSQEIEKFTNSYNTYISATTSLQTVGKKLLNNYFIYNNNPNKITNLGGQYQMEFTTNNLANMIQELQQAFNNGNNTYSFNNKIIQALGIEQADLDGYNELLNSIAVNSDGSYVLEDTCNISKNENPANNSITYTLDDGITIVYDTTLNLVQSVNKTNSDDDSMSVNGFIGVSLENCINSLVVKYTNDDGDLIETTTYQCDGTDPNTGLPIIKTTSNMPAPSQEESENIVNDILNDILKDMESSYGVQLAEALYSTENGNPAEANRQYYTGLGFNLSSSIDGSTKTLEEFYNEYVNAESIYLNTVFAPQYIQDVKAQLQSGYAQNMLDENNNPVELDYKYLTNVDFVLRYMAAEGFEPSATFDTVAKEFIVEQIMDEYGTPKYAWIDSTDTNNTGNADAKAKWYTNLFNRMKQGYKALENGLASSPEWIEFALESGIVTLEQVDASYNWQGLDYKACSRITEETDDAAVTKAEAEYTRAMNDIEAKDNIYDIELKNIDTEHSSLQTEYDSIKGVISKNIERTFNFYKNA